MWYNLRLQLSARANIHTMLRMREWLAFALWSFKTGSRSSKRAQTNSNE